MPLVCGANLHPAAGWITGEVKEAFGFTDTQALDLAKVYARHASQDAAVAWLATVGDCPQEPAPGEVRACKNKWPPEFNYNPVIVQQPSPFSIRYRLFGILPIVSLQLWRARVRVDWKCRIWCLPDGSHPPNVGFF